MEMLVLNLIASWSLRKTKIYTSNGNTCFKFDCFMKSREKKSIEVMEMLVLNLIASNYLKSTTAGCQMVIYGELEFH